MKKAFSIIVLFLLIFQSSFASTYSSDPQTFVKEMVNDAINTLKKTIKPLSDLRGSAIYRTDLAVGLLKRLLYCVSNKNSHVEVMKVNINE